MYCKPEVLVALINRAQIEGVVSNELIGLVEKIAAGVWLRYFRYQDQDDLIQSTLMQFVRIYRQIDVNRPPSETFNYLSTMVRHRGWLKVKDVAREKKRMMKYARILGSDIPVKSI